MKKSFLYPSLAAALALAQSACTTTPAPPPAQALQEPEFPIEVIPSGTGSPVQFRTIETGEHMRVIAVASESVPQAHTDIHLVNRSGKAFAVRTATVDLSAAKEHPIAEFPKSDTQQAQSMRVVYHTTPAPQAGEG